MSDMIDLLPCPFCGADAKAQYLHDSLGNNDTSISNIGCKNGCVHQSGFRQSSIAIAAWNKRAARPPAPDAVQALVKAWDRAINHPGVIVSCEGNDAARAWNDLCAALAAIRGGSK